MSMSGGRCPQCGSTEHAGWAFCLKEWFDAVRFGAPILMQTVGASYEWVAEQPCDPADETDVPE